MVKMLSKIAADDILIFFFFFFYHFSEKIRLGIHVIYMRQALFSLKTTKTKTKMLLQLQIGHTFHLKNT